MRPGQNVFVRSVTLHGDLVSVTEQRVNGPECNVQTWTGSSSDAAAPTQALGCCSVGQEQAGGGSDEAAPRPQSSPSQARPGQAAGLGLAF